MDKANQKRIENPSDPSSMDILNPSTEKGMYCVDTISNQDLISVVKAESQLSVQIRLMRAEKEANTLVGTSGWLSSGISIQELQ
jgi:hypothetical protein